MQQKQYHPSEEDVGKFFTEGVVRCWNRLPREAVVAPSLKVFYTKLDGVLGSLVSSTRP